MKIYFDENNKWGLILEDENNPKNKHIIAIPPSSEERTDLIWINDSKLGKYEYNIKGIKDDTHGIVIRIKNSDITVELI